MGSQKEIIHLNIITTLFQNPALLLFTLSTGLLPSTSKATFIFGLIDVFSLLSIEEITPGPWTLYR